MVMQNVVQVGTSKLPRIIVYIEPELKSRVERLARRRKRSLSNLINFLLEKAVNESEQGIEDEEEI